MLSQHSQDVARRAEAIYEGKLKAQLEQSHPDQFVVIEPDSEGYFLGATMSEAAAAARKAHPDRHCHIMRVGHKAAVHIGILTR